MRRVQRPTAELPVLHLETEIPSPKNWRIAIGGLVEAPLAFSLHALEDLAVEERVWDLHCVWGWSRPACRWGGVPFAWLLDRTRPKPAAGFALVSAACGRYASCLTLDEARSSFVALRLEGEPLSPEHGGPIRFVPPPDKWGFKSVKWATDVTLLQTFTPGMWETLVGNPHGTVPAEMLDLRFE